MGIVIKVDGEESNVHPLPIEVMLICDDATAFFCRGFATFKSKDGLIGARTEAVRAGWVERQGSGRWVCRECAS